MSPISCMPQVSVGCRLSNLLTTNVLRVNSLLPRSIQCSDASLKLVVVKPTHVYFETLQVRVLALSPYNLAFSDSQFSRYVVQTQDGWSIEYTLQGRAQICEFIDRLPERLPFSSTVHLVNNNAPVAVSDFIRHLDCGDRPYQTLTVKKYVNEDFRRAKQSRCHVGAQALCPYKLGKTNVKHTTNRSRH